MNALLIQIGSAALVASLLFGTGYMIGRKDGKVEQLQDSVEAYQKREGIDDAVGKMDDYRLCLELGGLPNDCAELRGVASAPAG